ncbi:FecR family protein [Flavitalea sp. BT771]|uniref:FecR family protein n=1 Tax=Flavitalea sp. BT771 TaxID=3063329 RepID=UPI0026E1F8DE|nr:FecR family protein [Flavitalea sp. BT771]MDO6433529.1 FecR family protein [Flavitalea sp. BT771]MDV6222566.1 FecR family protein [Flavitalea sp. BT771]
MGQEHKQYTWNLIAKKLTGEATAEELLELEELLRNNPELHYPMQTISDLWNPASRRDQQVAEQAFSRHLDRMHDLNIDYTPATNTASLGLAITTGEPGQSPRKNYRMAMLAAASTLVVLVIGGILLFRHRNAATVIPTTAMAPTLTGNEIFTGNGSRTHVTLPDGTIVWLNAGSRITYEKNFDAKLRAVTLTGEAFFDVAPNAAKPFVIHTAHIDIRVLGTSFNVKSYPSDKTTEATLIRGSIEVSIRNRASDRIVLRPNEKLIVNNEDSALLAKESQTHRHNKVDESMVVIGKPTYEHNSGAIIETSWIDNKLIFQDEAFSELARQMERWYGITIRFDGSGKEDLRFTGTFEKETIQQALDALKLTGNFNYSIDGTQVTIHD